MDLRAAYLRGQSLPAACRLFLFALLMARFSLASSVLPQEVYVWQRAWTEPVRRAVAERGEVFARIPVLKAEVTWQGSKPRVVQIPVDYPSLSQTKRPIGLALRIGPYSGSFSRTDPAITAVQIRQVLVF
jgi:hypothetical protein